jgi:pimeloyl-ACP methyl ester carboxylesterase
MWKQRRLIAGSHALNVAVGPASGEPLLLLHGVLRCWQDFLPILPALAANWHVHALDFRGHGQSDRVSNAYTVIDYVADALACVRSIGKPCIIYGHSLGAMVAAAAAAESPALVRGLVLEDPPFDTLGKRIRETSFYDYFAKVRRIVRAGGATEQMQAQLADIQIAGPDGAGPRRLGDLRDATSLRFSAACLTQVDAAVLDPLLEERWLAGYELDTLFGRIKCPTLLMQADPAAGGMLTDGDAARFQQLVDRSLRIQFPGVGHLIHWMDTPGTLRYVLGFLASLAVEAAQAAKHRATNAMDSNT